MISWLSKWGLVLILIVCLIALIVDAALTISKEVNKYEPSR